MLDPETIERVTKGAQDSAVRLQVRSALNPLLWLCAICTPVTFGLAAFARGPIQLALLAIGALPILCACSAYLYWMLKSPDRLHSEDYQLRRQALQMIYAYFTQAGPAFHFHAGRCFTHAGPVDGESCGTLGTVGELGGGVNALRLIAAG